MCTKFKLFLIGFSLILFGHLGYAATYYVSPTGNNGNSGLSLGAALLTIQAAANKVMTGDSVLIADGNYAGFDYRGASGTPGDRIVFKAIGTGAIITSRGPLRLDGINIEGTSGNEIKYIEVNGLKIIGLGVAGNGIRLVFADHCVVRNCTSDTNERGIFSGFTDHLLLEYNICSNAQDEHGIYISNSSDSVIVRYNMSFNNNNIGIHMNGDLSQGEDGINHSPVVYGNHIYENKLAAGINLDGVFNPMIFNNVIYNNHNCNAIILFQGDGAIVSNSGKIFNNTIVVPSDGRWGIMMLPGGQVNTEIYNNIILNLHSFRGCIGVNATTSFASNYNIVQNKLSTNGGSSVITFAAWQTLGFDANSYSVTNAQIPALFAGYAANDFHLTSSSLAKDNGTSAVSYLVANDLDGNVRPMGAAYDIGAYEYSPPLAVSDVSTLKVMDMGGKVSVSWQALVEEDGAKFEIERSTNGIDFVKINQVNANRKNTHYAVLDMEPTFGLNYYRVKTRLQNGEIKTSPIRAIDMVQTAIKVYPNPSSGEVYLENPELVKKVFVYNSAGILLKTIQNPNTKLSLDIPSGNYLLVFVGDGFEKSSQIIVKQ
ncbi:MAG TPA: right-handed parallel beta-helix repeat-containing protein [Saprospiraceae bacterium]|nr:right-handed parallel beta-helix repeat-containing protein [Saprospiraceae bacterium]